MSYTTEILSPDKAGKDKQLLALRYGPPELTGPPLPNDNQINDNQLYKILDYREKLPWSIINTKRWGKRPLHYIKKVVIHQALSNAKVEGINHYHIRPNHISIEGCPHICYHFFVGFDGSIYKCNDDKDITWHCKGSNMHSLGICCQGSFNGPSYVGDSRPTIKQLNSLKWLCNCLAKTYKLNSDTFFGHNELQKGKENCPGNELSHWIDDYSLNGVEIYT